MKIDIIINRHLILDSLLRPINKKHKILILAAVSGLVRSRRHTHRKTTPYESGKRFPRTLFDEMAGKEPVPSLFGIFTKTVHHMTIDVVQIPTDPCLDLHAYLTKKLPRNVMNFDE